MSYLTPKELTTKMIEAGEQKIYMSTKDTLIRAFMAGAILALAAGFAVTIAVQTGNFLAASVLFPIGFCLLNLLGFDLVTGVFCLVPLAWLDGRPGCTLGGVLRNWFLVFIGNFGGALMTALFLSILFTWGFTQEPNAVGQKFAKIGEARTLGFMEHGVVGWWICFLRGVMCNWMVSIGVVAAMMSTSVSGKVIGMWIPILVFFYMVFEHAVVNMFLFPTAMMNGANFGLYEYFVWNEIPTILGNIVGGLGLVGLMLYATHHKTSPSSQPKGVVAPAE